MRHPTIHIRPSTLLAATLLAATLLTAGLRLPAFALLNPNFTPKHVEAQSTLLCTVRAEPISADHKAFTLTVLDPIKGKADGPAFTVDMAPLLALPDHKDKLDAFLDLLKSAGTNAAFLAMGDIADGKAGALLHIDGVWCKLQKAEEAQTLKFVHVDPSLNSTFNGSTDMLIGAMRFIVRFPDAPIMPVSAGIEWTDHLKIGSVKGAAQAIVPVDANDDGKPDFLVASPKGDALYLAKGDAFEEGKGLASASLAAAWGDFDSDSRPDLASLSTAGLTVHFQKEAGRFTPREVKLPSKVDTASPTLWAVDLGNGKASLVAGLGLPVVLLNRDGKGEFETVALVGVGTDTGAGLPGPCLASDFTGDGRVDIVQVSQKRSALWRGRGGGAFDAASACGEGMGDAKQRQASVADLDGDGLLDIFLMGGGRTPALLQNRGGRFEDRMRQTGEPSYIIQAGAGCAALGDFNNDTFVDCFIGYEEEIGQFFFNRGFRSFAIAEPLKFKEDDVPGAAAGQTAAAWIDLDGNGTLELVSTLTSGDIYVSHSTLGQADDPRHIAVTIARTAPSLSAVVRCYLDGRCMGARVADRWGGPALLGITEPGRYLVKWMTADGQEGSRTVETDQTKTRLTIGGK